MATKLRRNLLAIGDAHGEYYSFAAVLIHAGLMDAELTWTGGRSICVQMGDILDRGSEPLQIDKLLDILQPQAKKAGGKIIRLVGNHELEILRKNYFITSLPYFQIEAFRSKLKEAVLSGAWQAAFSARGYVFTHAGICDNLYGVIEQAISNEKVTPGKIATYINKVFKEAVILSDYKHPIFNVSYLRGGSDRFGGIFWEDLSSLFGNCRLCPFKQVVGHTMTPHVVLAEDSRVIAIDVGMKKVFEGGFEYIKIYSSKKLEIIKIIEDRAKK
jgi:hypothetical protein